MTLDKAIQILQDTPVSVLMGNDLEYGQARQLLIEAAKQTKVDRKGRLPFRAVLLPGETDE